MITHMWNLKNKTSQYKKKKNKEINSQIQKTSGYHEGEGRWEGQNRSRD